MKTYKYTELIEGGKVIKRVFGWVIRDKEEDQQINYAVSSVKEKLI